MYCKPLSPVCVVGAVPPVLRQVSCSAGMNIYVLHRYDLHVLLVNHGKRCPRCAKNGKPRKASDGDCPLFGKKGIANSKEEADNSSDELIKSEEDASAESDVSEEKVDMKHVPADVKQEPSDNRSEGSDVKIDVKQEAEP